MPVNATHHASGTPGRPGRSPGPERGTNVRRCEAGHGRQRHSGPCAPAASDALEAGCEFRGHGRFPLHREALNGKADWHAGIRLRGRRQSSARSPIISGNSSRHGARQDPQRSGSRRPVVSLGRLQLAGGGGGDRRCPRGALLECLGETIWRAERYGRAMDANAYLECVQRAAVT
ncbi:MAG: DUF1841 family protein [Candidatus Accumulibacter sp.]|nr:DUF1841 family protein [Accumulibacter sp.]